MNRKFWQGGLCIALGLMIAAPAIASDALLQYVPEKVTAVVSINFNRIMNLPVMKKVRKENADVKKEFAKIDSKLKRWNLTVDSAVTDVMIFAVDENSFGAVGTTNVKEKDLPEVLKIFSEDHEIKVVKKTIAGKKCYVTQQESSAGNKPVAITYLKPNVFLMSEESRFAKVVNDMKGKKVSANKVIMGQIVELNQKAPLWAAFEVPKDNKQKGPMANVNSGGLSVDVLKNGAVVIDGDLECKDEQSVGMLQMQMQMMLMALASTVAQQDPQMAPEISKAIKIEGKKNHIKLNINIPKDLQDKIQNSVKKIQEKRNSMPAGGMMMPPAPPKK